jgi:hypothetical protein
MAGPSGRSRGPPKGMLVPATHDLDVQCMGKSWVVGTRSAMTRGLLSAAMCQLGRGVISLPGLRLPRRDMFQPPVMTQGQND